MAYGKRVRNRPKSAVTEWRDKVFRQLHELRVKGIIIRKLTKQP
tara:strand:- start:364 stop:495 length:132 start_codon:yes stop_codon:yes gene_type:complete